MNLNKLEIHECVEIPAADWTPENNRTDVIRVAEADPRQLVGRRTFWTAYWPNPDAPHLPVAQVDHEVLHSLLVLLRDHFLFPGNALKPYKENPA